MGLMAFGKKKVIVSKGAVVPAATAKAAKAAAAEVMKSMAAKYGEGTLVRMGDRVGFRIECITALRVRLHFGIHLTARHYPEKGKNAVR